MRIRTCGSQRPLERRSFVPRGPRCSRSPSPDRLAWQQVVRTVTENVRRCGERRSVELCWRIPAIGPERSSDAAVCSGLAMCPSARSVYAQIVWPPCNDSTHVGLLLSAYCLSPRSWNRLAGGSQSERDQSNWPRYRQGSLAGLATPSERTAARGSSNQDWVVGRKCRPRALRLPTLAEAALLMLGIGMGAPRS